MKLFRGSGQTAGIVSAVAAYLLWGSFPLYWKMVNQVPAIEILAHRIVWCFVFMVLVIVVAGKKSSFLTEVRRLLSNRKRSVNLVICAGLITVNWLTFIWAVNDNRIIETSFGYYINPLVSVLLGIVVLKERLSFWHTVSFVLAAGGVLNMVFHLGNLPWVSLLLAASFGLYGLYKKIVNLGAITSITLETVIVIPAALIYLVYLDRIGIGALTLTKPVTAALLIGGGAVTAIPLLLFSYSTTRLPLSIVGFTQYLSPTMSLLIGIFVYQETFTVVHFASFSLIWLALFIFSLASTPPLLKLEALLVGLVRKSTIGEVDQAE